MQIEVGVIGALVGFLISYISFMRNRDKDVKNDAAATAITNTKLDHIGSGVESIRVDMKVNDKRFEKLSEQIIRVDESAKSAHKRIDSMTGKE
ncbi:hypothetical protein [Bacillus sp. FSL K6-3431]|uniref:hypothetical protein n=1 Tax=Bacillus sp. FSL K6-3431 TaxID=2921500 RepID=UPI0030F67FCF